MRDNCYIEMGLSAYGYKLEAYLQETDKRVLIIHGEAERYLRIEFVQQVLEEIGNDQIDLEVIEKAGHNPAYEQPQETARRIREFLGTNGD